LRAQLPDASISQIRMRAAEVRPPLSGVTGGSTLQRGHGAWKIVSAAVAGVAVVGGVYLASVRVHPTPSPAADGKAQASGLRAPAAVNALSPGVPSTNEPVASAALAPASGTGVDERRASARRKSDRLAEEVSLMSRAETALKARHYTTTLRLLDEHQRQFPNGALAEERIAARAQALCGLGRTSEATTELNALSRATPGSPLANSARAACARGSRR